MSAISLFEQLHEAYLIVDSAEMKPVILNPAATKLFSTTLDEFTSSALWLSNIKPLLKNIHPNKKFPLMRETFPLPPSYPKSVGKIRSIWLSI